MRWLVGCATEVAPYALVMTAMLSAQTPPPSFTEVAKGNASNQQETRQVTVRTAAEWTALWKEHAPAVKMPGVDFTKHMVVGVFLGTKPSDGYQVEIVGVQTRENELIVEYVQRTPARGTMAAQILTEPYHLVAVAKHPGTVRFIHVPDTRKP